MIFTEFTEESKNIGGVTPPHPGSSKSVPEQQIRFHYEFFGLSLVFGLRLISLLSVFGKSRGISLQENFAQILENHFVFEEISEKTRKSPIGVKYLE